MSTTTIERTTRLRTPPARGLAIGVANVDRKAGIIRGFSVIQMGPALGHGMEIDETTLKQVADLGNAAKSGAKMRFTHPNMSSDGMGKYLGRATNFRIEGDRVLADAHISDTAYETPSGDLASYVFDLAEEDPTAFGASIAFQGKSETRLNSDGTPAKGKDGKPLAPVTRVERLAAVDIVDSPAANRDGLLSEETLPDWPARQATGVLDHLFAESGPDVLRAKVGEFLNHFLATKGIDPMATASDAKPADAPAALTVWNAEKKVFEAAPGVTLTEEQLAALNPKPVEAPPAAPATPPATEQLSETDIERKRCREIMAHCNAARMPQLAKGYIDSGLSVNDCMTKLFHEVTKHNAPLSDGGEEGGPPTKPDENAKYKAEYLAAKERCEEAGLSEEDFITSRRVSDGLEPLISRAKAGAK